MFAPAPGSVSRKDAWESHGDMGTSWGFELLANVSREPVASGLHAVTALASRQNPGGLVRGGGFPVPHHFAALGDQPLVVAVARLPAASLRIRAVRLDTGDGEADRGQRIDQLGPVDAGAKETDHRTLGLSVEKGVNVAERKVNQTRPRLRQQRLDPFR